MPSLIRTFKHEQWSVEVDPARQRLIVDVLDELEWSVDSKGTFEVPIAATPSQLAETQGFVSASLLAHKAKQFDDGLLAAIELAVDRPMTQVLAAILPGLQSLEGGTLGPRLYAAAVLGNMNVMVPEPLIPAVAALVDEFLAKDLQSKPIGFYTWSNDLKRIFQRDRLLQGALRDESDLELLVLTLHREPGARAAYERCLRLAERLTCRFTAADLRGPLADLDRGDLHLPENETCLFPPCGAYETETLKSMFSDRIVPEGFDPVGELIRRMRAGERSTIPTSDSGAYDYQTWALEALACFDRMPEAKWVNAGAGYREHLEKLFRGILTLTRETHVKFLETAYTAAAPGKKEEPRIVVRPQLSIEPLPTYYARRAEGYAFVRRVLEGELGEELADLRRLGPGGSSPRRLDEELNEMIEIFSGAAVTASRELGCGGGGDDAFFEEWRAGVDPDLERDARCMVPIFHDLARGKTKVWVFLGWAACEMLVHHDRPPEVKVSGPDGRPAPDVRVVFGLEVHRIAYPVCAEVYVSEILDRKQFRRHCDRHRTRREILAALK